MFLESAWYSLRAIVVFPDNCWYRNELAESPSGVQRLYCSGVEVMWEMTTLDLYVVCMICLALGFGLGVAWWEWLRDVRPKLKEAEYAGSSSNGADLHSDSGVGSLRGIVGPGAAWVAASSTGDQDHLGDSSAGSAAGHSPVGPTGNRTR